MRAEWSGAKEIIADSSCLLTRGIFRNGESHGAQKEGAITGAGNGTCEQTERRTPRRGDSQLTFDPPGRPPLKNS